MKFLRYALCFTYYAFFLTVNAQLPEVVVTSGHAAHVNEINFSPNRKWMCTASSDNQLKVIEVQSKREFKTYADNDFRIISGKFSPDSKYVGILEEGGALKIVDFFSDEVILNLPTGTAYGDQFNFVKDNDHIAYIGDNMEVVIVNFKTGEEIGSYLTGLDKMEVNPLDMNQIIAIQRLSEDNKIFFQLIKFDCSTGKILNTTKLKEATSLYYQRGEYYYFLLNIDRYGRYVSVTSDGNENGKNGILYNFSVADLKLLSVCKGHSTRIADVAVDSKRNQVISGGNAEGLIFWDIKSGKRKDVFNSILLLTPTCLTITADDESVLISDYLKNRYTLNLTTKNYTNETPPAVSCQKTAYDQAGKYLAILRPNSSVRIWDLEQNKISQHMVAHSICAFSPDGKYFLTMDGMDIGVFDPGTGKKKKKLSTQYCLVQDIDFHSDGKQLAGVEINGKVFLWDVNTKEPKQQWQVMGPGMYECDFNHENLLAVGGTSDEIKILDITSGDVTQSLKVPMGMVKGIKFSPDGKFLMASVYMDIYVWNTSDWSVKQVLKGHKNQVLSLDINAEGTLIASSAGNNAVAKADNSVILWDVNTGEKKCEYDAHQGAVVSVLFDNTTHNIYSSDANGFTKVWNRNDCKTIATMVALDKEQYLTYTPDNYYMASKGALQYVSLRIGNNLHSFEQFDLRLNRPDIVCSRLSKTPQGLIKAYKYLYKKRLRTMGFKEEDLSSDYHLPEVEIISSDLPISTAKSSVTIQIKASDSKYPLDRIMYYVNGVPVDGTQGIPVKDKNSKVEFVEKEVALVEGMNEIEVSCYNTKGVESLRATAKILKIGADAKPNLYVVTLGVNKYKDDKYNLTYPVKDASDVVSKFKNQKDLYSSVKSLSLTDEEVIKENLEEVKTFLSSAKPEDVVILFIAGHGILSDDYSYYFGTHNIDFNNPSENGIPYEAFEEILSMVKSYKKLLLMDTCHSGELDKEELKIDENFKEEEQGEVEFRAVGAALTEENAFGLENTKNSMENLFADVRKGTGAVVISSAGGAEFAMESETWNNGLFTYCFLKGLGSNEWGNKNQNADYNGDGKVSVEEIKTYVSTEVYLLSNKRQQPTSRSENLKADFNLWKF